MQSNESSDFWAKSEPAQAAGAAISAMLDASRKSSRTVQWRPVGDACEFEIIHRDGTLLAVAHVDASGAVRLEVKTTALPGVCNCGRRVGLDHRAWCVAALPGILPSSEGS